MRKGSRTVTDVQTNERTRMLSFRVTPQEQRRVRLRAAITGLPICDLVRGGLGGMLTEDPVIVSGSTAEGRQNQGGKT